MEKVFNVTGLCLPKRHYMADVSKKLAKTVKMVKNGDYFVINRPRQYGKTTMLNSLVDSLHQSEDYLVFSISFEGIGNENFENGASLATGFIRLLAASVDHIAPNLTSDMKSSADTIHSFDDLSIYITDFVSKIDKKIVVLIDEVDQSSNNDLFIQFLALLRNKFLTRETTSTFHSVVLAGLYDVKSLKLKLRPDDERKYNSPWNIAADYKVDMNLQASEIKPMLDEYCQNTGVQMNTQEMADVLFYHTSGYPFLVSKLCKLIDEDILPEKDEQTWTLVDMDEAVRLILREQNTNFDSLIKNLENNTTLYNLVYRIIMEGELVLFNPDDPLINLGLLHGMFKGNSHIKIHNRIYEQRIYNYMTVKTMIAMKSHYDYAFHYDTDEGGLDMPAVLLKFQQFMKEEFSEKDKSFLEQHGRLVFLSFLAPILNGHGHSFKEVQTSAEKRLDIVATYNQFKYIIELKRWYGDMYHQKGIKQLADYLDIKGEKVGYLVIFEHNKAKTWHKDWITFEDKKIFAVWV